MGFDTKAITIVHSTHIANMWQNDTGRLAHALRPTKVVLFATRAQASEVVTAPFISHFVGTNNPNAARWLPARSMFFVLFGFCCLVHATRVVLAMLLIKGGVDSGEAGGDKDVPQVFGNSRKIPAQISSIAHYVRKSGGRPRMLLLPVGELSLYKTFFSDRVYEVCLFFF